MSSWSGVISVRDNVFGQMALLTVLAVTGFYMLPRHFRRPALVIGGVLFISLFAVSVVDLVTWKPEL